MILYRPVGLAELRLIAESGFRAFPPRLSHQPIFYPVLTAEYARKIARDWNTTDETSGFAGWVTRFVVEDDFARRYPVQIAGGRSHEELWVPAEELEEFNRHIVGTIEVTEVYCGPKFQRDIDPATRLPLDWARDPHDRAGLDAKARAARGG
ncbi:ADP-ribosylation/crystallin J1 [Sorangium sp. So ce834]|uniref:ADP-ribosylation/crystallin J1 n=1 Tax=Sorangium sp. So ce834 TaxID=3133321 RepID=UPI003F61D940